MVCSTHAFLGEKISVDPQDQSAPSAKRSFLRLSHLTYLKALRTQERISKGENNI